MESYERLQLKEFKVASVVNWHFESIIKSINRRISFRQKFKDPWTIVIEEKIFPDTFIQAFKAIRDYKSEFGRTYSVKRDRNGHGLNYVIRFTHLGSLRLHFHKLSGVDKSTIDSLFSKNNNNGKAYIEVNNEKPCLLEYNRKKSILKIKISYSVENKYGTVCSF